MLSIFGKPEKSGACGIKGTLPFIPITGSDPFDYDFSNQYLLARKSRYIGGYSPHRGDRHPMIALRRQPVLRVRREEIIEAMDFLVTGT